MKTLKTLTPVFPRAILILVGAEYSAPMSFTTVQPIPTFSSRRLQKCMASRAAAIASY